MTTVQLNHVLTTLALHQLRDGTGTDRPLLLLHGLGEHTPAVPPPYVEPWTGPIWGLDFTGHGQSSVPSGGGYTAEVLMADVDHALAHLGEATVFGRGLGAYIALLISGARPELVAGAILTDGPGLAGGGPSPHSPVAVRPVGPRATDTPDGFALVEMARDIRPGDYATQYVRQAVQLSGLDDPISLVGVVRPPWMAAAADEPGVATTTLDEALARYATAHRQPVTPTPPT
ncbi:hypothetical protein BH10ACT1_BH10ACT1_28960 [soil metagenome]